MDDTIVRFDIRCRDVGTVDLHTFGADGKGDDTALYSFGGHAISDISGHCDARHHMVKQDLT